MTDQQTQTEQAPKGKRTVRRSVYGNLNGYIGGRFWVCIGNAFFKPDQELAERWACGEIDL